MPKADPAWCGWLVVIFSVVLAGSGVVWWVKPAPRDVKPYADLCAEHAGRLNSSPAHLLWSAGPDGAMALMAICRTMGLWPAPHESALESSR